MQDTKILFSQEFYEKYLSTIDKVHFTNREIDVITCLCNARGTGKMAVFLSIDKRTVETHIRNIMSKLECNGRDSIIDFIEKYNKIHYLKQYYLILQNKIIFEKSLKEISKLNNDKSFRCSLIQEKDNDPLVLRLKSHLELAGITVSVGAREKKGDYTLFVLPKLLTEEIIPVFLSKIQKSKNESLLIFPERENGIEIHQELLKWKVIDFEKQENYFFSFFLILKTLLPNLNLNKICLDFKNQYKKIFSDHTNSKIYLNGVQKKTLLIFKWTHVVSACFLLILIVSGLLFYPRFNGKISVHSDLLVPNESVFLNRLELIAQIDNGFEGKQGIQTVALIGIGGSGKTTLARQYAHAQKENVIWEINTETNASLIESFENLANSLSKTEGDTRALSGLKEIKNITERGEAIVEFVKQHLKLTPKWFLIYDNVEKFIDIQHYFPYGEKTWGCGKVLLTTRDANVQNNKHINNTIQIGELNAEEKFSLFMKIINHGEKYLPQPLQILEAKKILKMIPPFPLDIIIASHYIKTTNIPFSVYLENLSLCNKEFVSLQENILKEANEYSKTRSSIINISLKKIMVTNKEFGDLLLLISLIDSQNIPRVLLDNFKNNLLVDNFIFHLKKYSLISSNQSIDPFSNFAFSLHRSTQELLRSYFIRALDLEKDKKFMKSISNTLEDYLTKVLKKEDLKKMRLILKHIEVYLSHKNLINSEMEGTLKGLLGVIYYFDGDNLKAKKYLQESIIKLNKNYEHNSSRIAYFVGYLGNVFRDLGDYKKSKYFLRQSLSIYKKMYPKDVLRYGYFLIYLGCLERMSGQYEIAKNLINHGLALHKNYFPENENYGAWALGQSGILEREAGEYEEAQLILEKSLQIFKKDCPADHFDIAWALEHLAPIYIELGNYEKAKNALKQSSEIYALSLPDELGLPWILTHFEDRNDIVKSKASFKQIAAMYDTHFHENYIYIAWLLRHLGKLYGELENYQKAKLILEQCLYIYQKNYGDQHVTSAEIFNELGQVYVLEGNLQTGKVLIEKALNIFQKEDHPRTYLALENLAEIFIKKYANSKNKGEQHEGEIFKQQALDYLIQASVIIKKSFPKSSPHRVRIQDKIKKL